VDTSNYDLSNPPHHDIPKSALFYPSAVEEKLIRYRLWVLIRVCENFRETKQINNHKTFVLKGKSIDCINCDSGNAYGGLLDPISEDLR
jgi:hypothetical protein